MSSAGPLAPPEINTPPRFVVFEIPGLTPTLNELRKMDMHTYRKSREAMAWQVRAALNRVGYFAQEPMQRAAVAIARYSTGEPDHDGLVGGIKPLVDCLVVASISHPNGLGVIVDDKPARLALTVTSERAETRADQKIVVAISELPFVPVEEKPKRKGPRRAQRKLVGPIANRINAARMGRR